MTRQSLLLWLERGLLAAGVALGAWCAAVLVEARFHNAVPIPVAAEQLKVTQAFLRDGQISVDVFGLVRTAEVATPAEVQPAR